MSERDRPGKGGCLTTPKLCIPFGKYYYAAGESVPVGDAIVALYDALAHPEDTVEWRNYIWSLRKTLNALEVKAVVAR